MKATVPLLDTVSAPPWEITPETSSVPPLAAEKMVLVFAVTVPLWVAVPLPMVVLITRSAVPVPAATLMPRALSTAAPKLKTALEAEAVSPKTTALAAVPRAPAELFGAATLICRVPAFTVVTPV